MKVNVHVYSPLSDIYSASWGPDDDGRTVDGPGPLTRRALGQDGGNVKLRRYADMTKDDMSNMSQNDKKCCKSEVL